MKGAARIVTRPASRPAAFGASFPATGRGAWTPARLFAGGAAGAWYEPSPATCYQDNGQTTPADYTDTVAACVASYGTAGPLLQATAAAEPQLTATPDRLVFDRVDDNMSIDFTGSGGFSATLIQASKEGTFSATVTIPNGAWSVTQSAAFFPSDNIAGLMVVEGALSDSDIEKARQRFIANGAGDDFGGVISMLQWFRSRIDITALNVSTMNVSNVTTFRLMLRDCVNLSAIDISNWVTSSAMNFSLFAYGCTSLTTVTVNGGTGNPFADSPCVDYSSAFTNTNLTQQSIDDILVAINSAGTSGGTFNQSGGFAPSATGEAAIDALRARGWTITVTGAY